MTNKKKRRGKKKALANSGAPLYIRQTLRTADRLLETPGKFDEGEELFAASYCRKK